MSLAGGSARVYEVLTSEIRGADFVGRESRYLEKTSRFTNSTSFDKPPLV